VNGKRLCSTRLLAFLVAAACTPQQPRGHGLYVGRAYVDRAHRYSFQIPPGWIRPPAETAGIARDPKQREFLIQWSDGKHDSRDFPETAAGRARGAGLSKNTDRREKNRWLRALLAELRREGYDRANIRIAELGSNVFLVVSARPLDSIRELVDAQNGLRPIGNFAVVAQGGYTYVFAASIYEAAAERGFEEFLASVQFSQ
jgi:hypothetical protein